VTVRDGRAVASFDANRQTWLLKEVSSMCRFKYPESKFLSGIPPVPAGLTFGEGKVASIFSGHRDITKSRDITRDIVLNLSRLHS
jgi:hypothetical protein